jgi:hypothetical protein
MFYNLLMLGTVKTTDSVLQRWPYVTLDVMHNDEERETRLAYMSECVQTPSSNAEKTQKTVSDIKLRK